MNYLFSDPLIEQLRQQNGLLQLKGLTIRMPKYFGFCGGVSHAIQTLDHYIQKNPNLQFPIYLLGEIIHNQTVNQYFQEKGVVILPEETWQTQLHLIPDGAPIIFPAFGIPMETLNWLEKQCPHSPLIDTTCHYVRKIWEFTQQQAQRNSTIIIHGKPKHPETIATISRILTCFPEACIVIIPSLENLLPLIHALQTQKPPEELKVFNPKSFLQNDLILINQTTMLYQDTCKIGQTLQEKSQLLQISFKQIKTICPATQQRQDAAKICCDQMQDLILVIGGLSSSNTTQLFHLAEKKAPTYFIQSAQDFSTDQITHWLPGKKINQTTSAWLPHSSHLNITLLAGASCPDENIGHIIKKLQKIMIHN